MKSVPPRGSGWLIVRLASHLRGSHPILRGGTDFMPPSLPLQSMLWLNFSMDEIIIRFATTDDVNQLARFRLGLRSRPDTNIESEDEFLKRCEAWMADALNRSEWQCWVAVSTGSSSDRIASTRQLLLGAIWLQRIEKIPNPTSESESLAYITNFFVTESARNKGVGSQIMDEVLNWCREEKVHSVILWPTERSRPLYQRRGFDVPKVLFELTLGAT